MINQTRTNGNAATWAIVITVAVVLAGLFMIPSLNRSNGGGGSGGSPCLVPNLPLLQHIHPQMRILVDDKEEVIPTNIGIGACERALHTHDSTGELHVEAQDRHEYTLGEFFGTWGKSMEREGYTLEMTVDDVSSQEFGALKFKDKQRIVVQYKRIGNTNDANGR
ncbi:MAG: hypothetical protein Q7R85_01320 [bacterium]|nr:hypothetical protein [bacterium]